MKNLKIVITQCFILISFLLFTACTTDSIQDDYNSTIENLQMEKGLSVEEGLNDPSKSDDDSRAAQQYSPIPVYRFFKNGDHLYTTNYNEGVNADFQYEGVLGHALGYGGTPSIAITRWYNRATGERMITALASGEAFASSDVYNMYWNFYTNSYQYYPVNQTIIPGSGGIYTATTSSQGNWVYEGIIGLPSYTGMNIYRYYNPIQKDRLFTNDWNELGNGSGNYYYEFVAFKLNQSSN